MYFQDILFLAAPFFFVLLIYMLFKNRERRKLDAQQRAPTLVPQEEGAAGSAHDATVKGSPLPSAQKPPGPSTGPPGSSATPPELNCPKCNAVVYAGEETCWKCGAALPSAVAKSTNNP